MILAGGLGTRLRKVVSDRPKPMAEIEEGRPFLDYLVSRLIDFGFSKIIFCVSYMKENITEYFSQKYGSLVEFSEEDMPLGTAGALKNAENILPDRFAVLNGDSYIRLNYADLFQFHQKNNSDLTMTLSRISGNRFGRVVLEGKRVVNFVSAEADSSDLANAGVYVFERAVLDRVPVRTKFSLEQELIPDLIRSDLRVMGYVSDNNFIDMGVPESYDYLKKNPSLLE